MANSQKHTSKSVKSASSKRGKAQKAKRTGGIKNRRAAKTKKSSTPKVRKSGAKRSTSGYNLYMQQAVSQIKADHPDLTHQEAFKQAAHEWATSPENPKNQ